jgi:hypothetical protein
MEWSLTVIRNSAGIWGGELWTGEFNFEIFSLRCLPKYSWGMLSRQLLKHKEKGKMFSILICIAYRVYIFQLFIDYI